MVYWDMLKKIILDNYKCFLHREIELASLTVLSGLNSTGKSSVINALLLIRQSNLARYDHGAMELHLNGKYIDAGVGLDVLCEYSDSDNIGMRIEADKGEFQSRWKANVSESILMHQGEQIIGAEDPLLTVLNRDKWLDFSYVSASRLGPQSLYAMSLTTLTQNPTVGKNGEFAAEYLELVANDMLPIQAMKYSEELPGTVQNQLNAWMGVISPGVRVIPTLFKDLRKVKLGYQYEQSAGLSREYSAMHVGFGLTHVMPIVLAVLTAKPGGLLLIENPEAHLHPRGQTELGKMFARAAKNGVQIVIETHSDHIINGIRMAVKHKEINSEDVLVQFFSNGVTGQGSAMDTLHIDKEGKIDSWPDDFLAEWENSLLQLM